MIMYGRWWWWWRAPGRVSLGLVLVVTKLSNAFTSVF
jgi:hypothetical protein